MSYYVVVDNDGWEHSWHYLFKFTAKRAVEYWDIHQTSTAPHSIKKVK